MKALTKIVQRITESQEVMTSRLNSNQEKNNMAGSRSRQLEIKKTGATDQGGLA